MGLFISFIDLGHELGPLAKEAIVGKKILTQGLWLPVQPYLPML